MQHKQEYKLCAKCLKTRNVNNYKARADGSLGYCYECELAYYREYNSKRYPDTPEARAKESARQQDKYNRITKVARQDRKKYLIQLCGGACQRCGYNKNFAALDFHHENPAEKRRTVSHLLAMNNQSAFSAAMAESIQCEILCSNCHREETFPDCAMVAGEIYQHPFLLERG